MLSEIEGLKDTILHYYRRYPVEGKSEESFRQDMDEIASYFCMINRRTFEEFKKLTDDDMYRLLTEDEYRVYRKIRGNFKDRKRALRLTVENMEDVKFIVMKAINMIQLNYGDILDLFRPDE